MKLYIGNLDYSTTEQHLQDAFAQFGEVVSAVIINDRDTGRSKGFGFVEMNSRNAAMSAITQMNGQELNGRELRVNEAQARTFGDGNRGRRY